MNLSTVLEQLEQHRGLVDQTIAAIRQLSNSPLPAVLAQPPAAVAEPAPTPAAAKRPAPKPMAPAKAQDGRESPLRDAIMKAFVSANGPLTSSEVFDRVAKVVPTTTSGSVYQCLRQIRDERGWIEQRTDELGDGRQKWFLTEAGKATA